MLPQQSPTADHDRLNGWKEIAAFLGKGTRTAQRWERELGLPVHRIGHERGEIVYAFRSEIEAWSRQAEQARAMRAEEAHSDSWPPDGVEAAPVNGGDMSGSAALTPGHVAGTRARARRFRPRLLPTAIVASAALALAIYSAAEPTRRWLGGLWTRSTDGARLAAVSRTAYPSDAAREAPVGRIPEISKVRVAGHRFHALDPDGSVLWTHTLDIEIDPFWERQPDGVIGDRPVIADLDGDRSVELALIARTRDTSGALYAFNADGTARFVVNPDTAATFGDVLYTGPWVPWRLFSTAGPAAGRTLWAVFVHRPLFPSFVLELDPNGQVRSRYWSDGYVEFVDQAQRHGRPVVLVGAGNNEHKGASLAVFNGEHLSGSAPAVVPKYRCVDCPAGRPDEFLVFPRACWQRAGVGGETSAVRRAWIDTGGRLNARIDQGSAKVVGFEGLAVPVLYYTLDADLREASVEVDASYLLVHRQFERAGVLDHAFNDADRRDLLTVLRWQDDRFVRLRRGKATQ